MGDHTLTYFDLPQNVRLELIDYTGKAAKKDMRETDIVNVPSFLPGDRRSGELRKICLEKGVFIRKEPSYVEKLACSTMLVTDPNGVEIEIIEK